MRTEEWRESIAYATAAKLDLLDAMLSCRTGQRQRTVNEPTSTHQHSTSDRAQSPTRHTTDDREQRNYHEQPTQDSVDTHWGIPGPSTSRTPLQTPRPTYEDAIPMPLEEPEQVDLHVPPNHSYHGSIPVPLFEPAPVDPPPIHPHYEWHELPTGEVYRTVAGAGLRLRRCVTEFERLKQEQEAGRKMPWDPFLSLDEWELAKWFAVQGIPKAALDEFFKLKIISDNLQLSFTSHYTLYNRLNKLPGGAKWQKESITLKGNRVNRYGKTIKEHLELWYRDPVEVVRDLLAQPDFRESLVYQPQETYLDSTLVDRVYDEMWTGDWWLKIQELLPYGATLIPLILSTDKTCLTNFSGNKQAWPVYLTIGNLPKATRRRVSARATVLVGYLPVSKYKCCTPGKARQRAEHWLFHTCMSKILNSLEQAGSEGVEVECSDGWVRRCFPVVGAYVADQPEQCLVACCKQNTCYACKVPPEERGANGAWEAKTQREVGVEIVAEALGINSINFDNSGYKPVGCAPFWYSLPHCNIFTSLTPDLLHQVHKGLFKDHVYDWCRKVVDDDELIDERFSVLPRHPSVVSFKQGVTMLTQTTGRQHKAMEKSIAAVVSGLVPDEMLGAVQAAMDFIAIASLSTHSTSTLTWLQETLDDFHKLKQVILDLGIRTHFNFAKFHALCHYVESIRSRGSLDGYNTESSERLHIDMAKHGYNASNKREYIKQMTVWRYRLDATLSRDNYIRWTQTPALSSFPLGLVPTPASNGKLTFTGNGMTLSLPKHPYISSAAVHVLETRFHTYDFFPMLRSFIDRSHPNLAWQLTGDERFDIFVKADISIDPDYDPYARDVVDTIHAFPSSSTGMEGEQGQIDTVLVRKHPANGLEFGMSNHLVALIRVIFRLPRAFNMDQPLAYVEWFTPAEPESAPMINRYRVRRQFDGLRPSASIIPLLNIRRTCRLLPDYADPSVVCSDNMLDSCNVFFIDRALDEHMFRMLY